MKHQALDPKKLRLYTRNPIPCVKSVRSSYTGLYPQTQCRMTGVTPTSSGRTPQILRGYFPHKKAHSPRTLP